MKKWFMAGLAALCLLVAEFLMRRIWLRRLP